MYQPHCHTHGTGLSLCGWNDGLTGIPPRHESWRELTSIEGMPVPGAKTDNGHWQLDELVDGPLLADLPVIRRRLS
jgi:hypothetical protein